MFQSIIKGILNRILKHCLSLEYFFSRDCNARENTIVKSPKSIIAHTRVKVFYKFIAYFYTIFTVELNLTHGLF